METIIPGSEMDQFGDGNDPFFALSQFDLDLQQQVQAMTQQQQQQSQRSMDELWHDFDHYLPVDCQSFMMNEPTTMNDSTMGPTSPLPGTSLSDISAMNDIYKLRFAPTAAMMASNEFATTSTVNAQLSPQNIVKEEYSSPEQQFGASFPQPRASLRPSISISQQNNGDNNTTESTSMNNCMPTPHLPSSFATNQGLAETIAGINWNFPVLPHADSDKVPIHRLKPATDIQTSPSSSTDLPSGVGKQKKTAHNAIERRYRNNINDRITELKNAVPALLHAKLKEKTPSTGSNNKRSGMMDEDDEDVGNDDGEEYLDGVAVATKLNKATILHKATEYIHHLKRTNNDRKLENDALQHLLAQLPGGRKVLVQYQIQKLQREQMMQQQLAMERQWMKLDQQTRKKEAAAASKRKRANRRGPFNNKTNHDDFDDGSLSSTSGDHPRTPPSDHDTGLANNRVFMALFMAISFFSSSPLTTPAGSEQVNDHNHISRTATSTLNVTESYNSHEYATKYADTPWISWMDGWSALRLFIFIICLIQLLFPNFQTRVFGHSFKIRRIHSTTKSKRLPVRNSQHTGGKFKNLLGFSNNTNSVAETPSISPGTEKCIRMTQFLVHSIFVDHNDISVTISPKNKLGLFSSLIKELVLFVARHVCGYAISTSHQVGLDDNDWAQHQHDNFGRWKHAFKWIKLNECECLGGNPFLSRLTLLYHSVCMLNLVDSLQDDELEAMIYGGDDDEQQQQQQLSSMRARAYATATLQISLGMPFTYLANRIADYLWRVAMNEANEDDTWACMTDNDDEGHTSNTMMTTLSTKTAWMETLNVIRNEMPAATAARQSKDSTTNLSLSAYAPTLIPTAILSNLHLLDRLESDFQTLIDNMMMISPTTSTDKQHQNASISLFSIHMPSTKNDVTRGVANWFTCVGATVEALWRNDVTKAEQGMLSLARHVPRVMTVPGQPPSSSSTAATTKKKERQSELDAMVKQQVVHMLAGATMVLKQHTTNDGIKELAIGEQLRQQRIKRVLASTYELEATHVEGRVMALAEFAVILVALKGWVSTWPLLVCSSGDDDDNNNNGVDLNSSSRKTRTQEVRSVALSLRRMVCRPALMGRLETQQRIVDRMDRLGRYVDAAQLELNNSMDSADECSSDVECDDDQETVTSSNNKESFDTTKQYLLANHMHKMMAIIQGN